eukprot:m.15371 g.15371  ORF g.15371 m.15371 type:complete len:549 (-) comp10546_c0_seq1:156-1802(-)
MATFMTAVCVCVAVWGAQGSSVNVDTTPAFNFSNTFGSNMVLGNPATIWGFGIPGAAVTTSVSPSEETATSFGTELQTVVAANGTWRQPLAAMPLGLTAYSIKSVSNGNTLEMTGVLFGHVILCSGQSNVDLISVSKSFNASAEVVAAVAFKNVRIFRSLTVGSDIPLVDLPTPTQVWTAPTSSTINAFSGVCWFAARDLYQTLGGKIPIGVVQSAAGGTAVRNWAPTEALAKCPQPYNSPAKYGVHPYEHAVLYNAMIHPFSIGPASFKFVLWDQAESDSYPQTPIGYYGCQTVAHINSWRNVLGSDLPWIFVHLQPYTDNEPFGLEDLRSMQLQALGLPLTGFASAVDLGDPMSTFGNVHFQNKQAIAKRIIGAAMRVAFGQPRGSTSEENYPPPSFISQTVSTTANTFAVNVTFDSDVPFKFVFGATNDLNPYNLNGSSAICPPSVQAEIPCSSFQIMLDDGFGNLTFVNASADIVDGVTGSSMVTLTAQRPSSLPKAYAVGSTYAWGTWPLATLFVAPPAASTDKIGLPMLPWSQALTMVAPSF